MANAHAKQVRLLVEDQIAAREDGRQHHGHAHGLSERAYERIVECDPHGTAVVLFGATVESTSLVRFTRKRLNRFESAERLLEAIVDVGNRLLDRQFEQILGHLRKQAIDRLFEFPRVPIDAVDTAA